MTSIYNDLWPRERCVQLVSLHHADGLSFRKAALILNTTPGSVAGKYDRLRNAGVIDSLLADIGLPPLPRPAYPLPQQNGMCTTPDCRFTAQPGYGLCVECLISWRKNEKMKGRKTRDICRTQSCNNLVREGRTLCPECITRTIKTPLVATR